MQNSFRIFAIFLPIFSALSDLAPHLFNAAKPKVQEFHQSATDSIFYCVSDKRPLFLINQFTLSAPFIDRHNR